MKRLARIAILLVIVMVGALLSSCAVDIVETKVQLKITAGSDQIFDGEITVTNESPSVLQIVKEAAALYSNLSVSYDDEDTRVTKISYYYDTTIDSVEYFWEYKINGTLPDSGRANTNTVTNGDVIEYVFSTSTPTGNNKVVYGTYDSALGLFSEDSSPSSDSGDESNGETTDETIE